MGKRKTVKRVLLTVLCVILALILFVMIFATAFVNRMLNQMNRVDPDKESALASSAVDQLLETDPDLETISPDSTETLPHITDVTFPTKPVETTAPDDLGQGDHIINILLIGQDREEGQSRQRSDTMILVTVNKSTKTITLTSFMRDQYVQIPGYLPHKLNHTYQYGGMSLLNETLLLNFGVEVDGNVEVDLGGFVEIIDMLGGVEIDLTEQEAAYIGACFRADMRAGVNLLNGDQALMYARLREIDSDYRRAERQRKVLTALLNKYKSQPLDKLITLTEQILPMVTTDMTNGEILGFVAEIAMMLPDMQLNTMRIPVDGTFQQGNVQVREGVKNWFQYNIDFEANRKVLREIFAEKE